MGEFSALVHSLFHLADFPSVHTKLVACFQECNRFVDFFFFFFHSAEYRDVDTKTYSHAFRHAVASCVDTRALFTARGTRDSGVVHIREMFSFIMIVRQADQTVERIPTICSPHSLYRSQHYTLETTSTCTLFVALLCVLSHVPFEPSGLGFSHPFHHTNADETSQYAAKR